MYKYLTPRETALMQMIEKGMSVKEIHNTKLITSCDQKYGGYTNIPVGKAQLYNIKKRAIRKINRELAENNA